MITRDEFIKSYIAIDQHSPTGLRWIGHPNKTQATKRTGNPAGCLQGKGYYKIYLNGMALFNHRVVWFLHSGNWPEGQIDHIDGVKTNNIPSNLRDVSGSENCQNIIAKGYCWNKQRNKWQAQISLGGKRFHLGMFSSKEDARSAYLKAKQNIHPTAPERCYE